MKKTGQIIELDPTKKYVMFVKRKSCLAKMLHSRSGHIMKGGAILFVDSFSEFKLVENSDRVIDVKEDSNGQP